MARQSRMYVTVSLVLILTACVHGQTARKRALLIGINDYSASHLTRARGATVPGRSWPSLDGAVNDVRMARELLVSLHGFTDDGIVTLTDQQATRAAIRQAIDRHLVAPAAKGDVIVFYFSGHGSQVRNTRSAEKDQLDESLVPADSILGAPDIRDKELRGAFNRILDSGAQLTIILDACHSGSGARGLDGGLQQRGVSPDERDVADAADGPEPEKRGALVLSAAQDFDLAFETLDPEHKIRGAFSWALARAMRDAEPGESAAETFLRAQARLRFEMPSQTPVIAGRDEVRLAPLFGASRTRGQQRAVIAVESRAADGTYALLGGWANGITVGSRLRSLDQDGLELEVTSLIGAGRSTARLTSDVSRGASVRAGTLLAIKTWAGPPGRGLRIWIPCDTGNAMETARAKRDAMVRRKVQWIDDPTEVTPTHIVRWRGSAWERVANGLPVPTSTPFDDPFPAHTSLFVQFPASQELVDAIGDVDGTEQVDGPRTADYILTGRLHGDQIEYAWIRPGLTAPDQSPRLALPVRTAWTVAGHASTAGALREVLIRLRHVQGWHELPTPPDGESHYQLAIRDATTRQWATDGPLIGLRSYQLVLRLRQPSPARPLYPRYLYAFIIDSDGKSVLLFPRSERGFIENRLPPTNVASQPITNPPPEIPLGGPVSFIVSEPYGLDSYFLLSTEEPLSNTASLEWDGVRGPHAAPQSPLEKLLISSLSGTRGNARVSAPPTWSIERMTVESVTPRGTPR